MGEPKPSGPHCREKLLARRTAPVPKPTQAGRERILRCAGKPSLRNSANCIRNFGKRMAGTGEDPLRLEPGPATEEKPKRLFTTNTGACKREI